MTSPMQHGAGETALIEFDYVVIGAGSAGCAIASRLADDPSVTVALIEAGPHDHHFTVWTPIGLAALIKKAGPRNYAYHTEPQAGFGGRRSYQPRGRGLGGSSSINGMVYIRGHREDYEEWKRLGCEGWGYEDVLPYFRRSERNERHAGHDDTWHGGGGPLRVSELRTPNPFSRRFISAALQAGYCANDDFNGAEQEGVGLYQVTQHNGERWNTARAYLHGGKVGAAAYSGGRPGLTVLPDTQVLRIVFEGRRARGVLVSRDGQPQTIRARREVIVSAGAFNSPQLLMASGVGPAAHLRERGVPVVHDLPGVGQNLQDHPDVIVSKQLRSTDLYGRTLPGVLRMAKEVLRYRRDRTGMVSSNFAEAGAFIKSRPGLATPDLQLHFVPALLAHGIDTARLGHGYSCHVCVLRPKSRGEVRLRSADMREAPVIDPRFLSHPDDVADMVAGVKAVRRIYRQAALAEVGGRELFTGAFGDDDGNDAAIEDFVRQYTDSVYHPVGTCKMGTDPLAVVDPALRVHGLDGLRVADASVMPTLVAGNTNATSIMIGEKAADLIGGAWW